MRRTVLLLLLVACTSQSYQKALDASLSSLNAARDSFTAWDAKAELAVVANAPPGGSKAALEAHRKVTNVIIASFTAAYAAIAVASVKADAASITAAGEAVLLVYTQLRTLFPGRVLP